MLNLGSNKINMRQSLSLSLSLARSLCNVTRDDLTKKNMPLTLIDDDFFMKSASRVFSKLLKLAKIYFSQDSVLRWATSSS